MKILLVGINARYTHTNLAIRRLRAAAEGRAETVELAEYTINMPCEHILDDILKRGADAVGFSVYIWNSSIVLSLMKELRRAGMRVFAGGPEATFSYEEFIGYSDCIIYGEGENAFPQVLDWLNGTRRIEDTASVYYMRDGKVRVTPAAAPVDMETLPEPYGLSEKHTDRSRVIYYESSRGCPFSCSYCLSGRGEKLRSSSAEKVEKDMARYISSGIRHVKFVDRTFNADRKRAKRIWSFIAGLDGECEFHFEIAADLLDDESVGIINTAPEKRIRLEIGVQSVNMDTLKAVGRSQDVGHIRDMTAGLRKGNAVVHLDLIAGLPYEDLISFRDSLDTVMSFGADEVQLGFLKLLKGSRLYDEAEKYGIECSKEPPYEVISTRWLSHDDIALLKKAEYLLGRIYNSGLFRNTMRYLAGGGRETVPLVSGMPVYEGSYFDALIRIDGFAKASGKEVGGMGETELARLLLDFGMSEGLVRTRDILRYDMLKKKRRPFLPEELEDGISDMKKDYFRRHPELPGLRKGKRPWHFARVEEFMTDVTRYEKEGVLDGIPTVLLFDYINQRVSYLRDKTADSPCESDMIE